MHYTAITVVNGLKCIDTSQEEIRSTILVTIAILLHSDKSATKYLQKYISTILIVCNEIILQHFTPLLKSLHMYMVVYLVNSFDLTYQYVLIQ